MITSETMGAPEWEQNVKNKKWIHCRTKNYFIIRHGYILKNINAYQPKTKACWWILPGCGFFCSAMESTFCFCKLILIKTNMKPVLKHSTGKLSVIALQLLLNCCTVMLQDLFRFSRKCRICSDFLNKN